MEHKSYMEPTGKIAIIGANGNMGLKRVMALQHLYGVEFCQSNLVLCDLQFDRCKQVAAQCQFENNYQAILNEPLIEFIILSIPNGSQRDDILLQCLAAKKHVLVEKPLTLNPAVIDDAFGLALQHDIFLKTAFNLDYFPGVQTVIKNRKKLGKLRCLNTIYGNGGFNPLLGAQEWFKNPELTAGVENFMGSHMASLLWMFAGDRDIEHIHIEKQHNYFDHIADTAIITVRLDNFLFNATISWSLWKNRFLFSLLGDDGLANIDGFVKYVKYGQPGETVSIVERQAGMPKETTHLFNYDNVDHLSTNVEFTDHEIHDWIASSANAVEQCEKEYQKNIFIHRCVTANTASLT